MTRDYAEFAKLDIAQPQIQVYSGVSVNADRTITLAESHRKYEEVISKKSPTLQ